jgi:hypothetical protein
VNTARKVSYKAYVKDLFMDHQKDLGTDWMKAEDLFNDSDFSDIEKQLVQAGYDLKKGYTYYK